jgi:acyl-CoA reductase-like NAD-dependent aldehyde dehydrogenase/nicotinamidase-related amidase
VKPALLLIDLQYDFLRAASLEPSAGEVVAHAAALLRTCRELQIPVVHAWLTIPRDKDVRMPHWKRLNKWACVEGTDGHATPEELLPSESEIVVRKTYFSAFSSGQLDGALRSFGCDALIIAGVYLQGCIQYTVIDAYERGLEVIVADDAVASDEPMHAAATRRYLADRAARFLPVCAIANMLAGHAAASSTARAELPVLPAMWADGAPVRRAGLPGLTHCSPARTSHELWQVPVSGEAEVREAVRSARRAWRGWEASALASRRRILCRAADLIEARCSELGRAVATQVGKPLSQAEAEVVSTVEMLRAIARRSTERLKMRVGAGTHVGHRPLGVVAVVTPWNNPLGMPVGKIAPALLYGNVVVWKPAVPASALAHELADLLGAAGCPAGVVNLVCGDASTSLKLMLEDGVDAVTITGGSAAGWCGQEACVSRRIPFQAELGGNNAAIVWPDADLEDAAAKVAEGAFAFAGQRCTANRRVIVHASCYEAFLDLLRRVVAGLAWGDPLERATVVGPMISVEARTKLERFVGRAGPAAKAEFTPHALQQGCDALVASGAYYPPTIICCDEPAHEIVQEETFGPVLVVQRAQDWDDAVALCNGVRQGLVASLFSHSRVVAKRFLAEIEAGVLKLNAATAGVNVTLPFSGWKSSGIGPAEHGSSDREFFTRVQTLYGGAGQPL